MSKLLELTAQIVVNQDTGKRRIQTTLYRDETLDLSFIMTAGEAEQWGAKLMLLAEECRKPNPTPDSFWMRFKRRWLIK
jgi:hypothetical protein